MSRRGGVYTPAATVEAEALVHDHMMNQIGALMLEDPLRVWIDYYEDGQWIRVEVVDEPSTVRPDVDNLAKLSLDGLQAKTRGKNQHPGLFKDDRQIVDLWVQKH